MDIGFSMYFSSNMGSSKSSLSPTLFCLCIDKLGETVNKVAKEDELDGLVHNYSCIDLFLYYSMLMMFFSNNGLYYV